MRIWLILAGLSGASAVLLGAYGAHGLQADERLRGWFETAVMWHAIHAAALAAVAALAARSAGWRARLVHGAGTLFALGTVLFCGTLYAMVLAAIPDGTAPLGGIFLALGWLSLAAAGLAPATSSSDGPPRS